jgi:NADPH-dependent ferric siderophore reductase
MAPPSEHTARVAARLDGAVELDLELTGAHDVLEGVRELRLRGDLTGFAPWPGQDLMVSVPPGAVSARFRRYTVRRWDPATGAVALWVTTATGGPGASWAAAVVPGGHVDAVGPRGKIALDPTASTHVFVIDESGLAAAYAMAEALRPRAVVHLVVALAHPGEVVPEEIQPRVASGVTLVARTVAAGEADALREAVEQVAWAVERASTAAYVFGELALTRATAELLGSVGVDEARVAVKPYWRNDRANEANGEPDRSTRSE